MALVTVQRSPTPSTSSSPCVSESGSGEDDRRSQPRSISESFLTVKGAALFLPRGNGSSPTSASRFAQLRSKHAGDLQQHLQTMFTLLRPEDNIKLAVRLESTVYQGTRYMVVVSTNGRQDTEESLVLGMDFSPADSSCSVGLVLPLWSDSLIHLDGDGGFSVSTDNRIHVFKPVSVQAMWSALQSLHKACEVAHCHNYFPGSLFLTWVSYYQSRVSSDQSRINEWNAMQDVQSHRADSPVMFSDVPTERERTERLIKTRLREIMMHKDLENVTCKEIRTELEVHMVCNLCEFKEYIDKEMILILGQMDSPTEIFDHVCLGSEWNASNLEELQNSGVQYILNVTREIDNFFPGVFEYHNIRVYDEEATDLLAYWNDTYKFISRARKAGAKCLVHCKMGVSRSASTVIAYAMKEYGWDLERAFNYVKERRAVTKPNPSFMRQLEEYQGILLASKQRHNKLWRSHSDSDLSEHHEPLCKTVQHPHTLGRSDPRNQGNSPAAPSLQELLQPLGSPSNTGQVVRSISECGTPSSAGKVVQSSSLPNATATQENILDTNQETRTDALLTSTTGDQSLGTGDQSLGTGDQSLGTGDQSLGSGDQSLGTGDQSLGTGDQSLGTGDQSLGTGDQSLGTGDQSLGTGDQSLGTGDQSLGTGDQSLGTGDQSLGAGDQSLGAGDQSLGAGDQSLGTGDQSLGTGDQSLGTGDQSLGTGDQSLGTGDQSLGTGDQSLGTGDQSLGTGDQSLGTGDQSLGTGDQSLGTGDQSLGAGDQSLGAGDQSLGTGDQSLGTGDQSLGTGDQSLGTGDQSLGTGDQSLGTGDQSLGTGDQSLGTGDQSLGTGDQSLGTGDQSLGTGDQSLGTGDQSLGAGDQSLGAGDQSLGTGDQSLGTGDQSLGTGDQSLGSGDQSLGTGDQSLGTGDLSLGTGDQNPSTAAATTASTGSQAHGESVCSQSPPLSNGLCDYEEDHSTPLPQPRAATVVPGISTVTVAETVPVRRPHPPPIQHHLVSPVALPTSSDEDETPKAKEPSTTLPKEKYCQLQVTPSVPESSSMTPETSTQTAGPQEPSTPVPDKKLDCDQRLPGASLDSLASQQDPALEAERSSALSTDHINFFSAREKFQGLTQDGRTRCLSDQALQQSPQPIPRDPGQEQQQQEDPSVVATGEGEEEEEVEERKRESIVSVHLIVTELESMTHTVAPPPGPPSQPEPTASQDHAVGQSNQEVESKDAESQQEVDVVKEEVKDEAEEMEAVSHSADWAMGSVRRVTQQLEQRMRQDSPSPPPPSLPPTHPHRRSPLLPHSREHSPPASNPLPETNSNPQNAPLGPQGSEVSTVQEKGGGCSPMEEDGGQEAWRGLHEDSVQMHKHNLSDGSLASTLHPTPMTPQQSSPMTPQHSSPITPLHPTLNSALASLSSVDFLCLEGVTEFESGTDWDSLPGRGPPGDDHMRETWETLRELGAFLRQVSGGGAKVPRCVGQVWGEGTQARQKRVRGGERQRAREVEARIRQAGLTPPSLMKRSASLAKLGCLDLSANDLTNWDISPTSPATPAVELLLPSTEADESSRKLRVLFHNALSPSVSTSRQESLTNRAERPCESGDTPSEHLHSPTSNQGWQKEKHPDSGHALSLKSDLISVATQQQYGRTHPLRRLKKRTVSTLYHTM